MLSTIAPLMETLEQLAAKEPVLRRRLPSSNEMEKVWRDFGVHMGTFRTIAAGEGLPTAIELNLLRYNVAAIEHHLKMLAGDASDPEIRAARQLASEIRAITAESPVRSIVPRLRHSRPGAAADSQSTCPRCGSQVRATVEEGEIRLDWGDSEGRAP